MMIRTNLSGTVIRAFISIALGPRTRNIVIKSQQNKLEKNKEPAKADGSPS